MRGTKRRRCRNLSKELDICSGRYCATLRAGWWAVVHYGWSLKICDWLWRIALDICFHLSVCTESLNSLHPNLALKKGIDLYARLPRQMIPQRRIIESSMLTGESSSKLRMLRCPECDRSVEKMGTCGTFLHKPERLTRIPSWKAVKWSHIRI